MDQPAFSLPLEVGTVLKLNHVIALQLNINLSVCVKSNLAYFPFLNGPTRPFFCSFQTQILQKNYRLHQDSYSDRRTRRRVR